MGVAGLFFVESGVKVDGKYYQDVLPSQQILPAIRHVAGDNFVFQQDSAPAHRARDTVELLQRETADFISPELCPPNSPDLNPVDYKIWGSCSSVCTGCRSTMSANLSGVWSGLQQCCWCCCQRVEKASAGVCSREGRTFRTPAVGCIDSGMKLSIDSPCTTCFWSFQ